LPEQKNKSRPAKTKWACFEGASMIGKNKGNLLLTFIMLVALSVIIFSFLSFIGTRLKDSIVKIAETSAFYAAEAGLNKAIWYLATPVAQGGRGFSWRTTNNYEVFGRGGYRFSIIDIVTSQELLIISTGEVAGILRTVCENVNIGGLPPAFDYSVFSNSSATIWGNTHITGSIFVNGNTLLGQASSVTGGYVYHPFGTSISGTGTYTNGGEPTPLPSFPVIDTSYYDAAIASAGSVPSGDRVYNNATINLNGGTVYVKGNVTISGNTTINGPGSIVATGQIAISGNTYGSSSVKYISSGSINVTGNVYTNDAIYYSSSAISASGNTRVNVGGLISKGGVSLGGNVNVFGLIYSYGTASMSGNPILKGALVSSSMADLSGSVTITYDSSVFPKQLPPGFPPSSLAVKKGTWKGD